MRTLYRAIAVLVLWMATSVGATAALTEGKAPRQFTAAEHKCLAEALWHERASTIGWALGMNPEGTRLELRLMGYSMKVRALADSWYNQHDWGGPDLCGVIKKRVGHVCQYSYNCMKHDAIPIAEKSRWEKFVQIVVAYVYDPTKETWKEFLGFAKKTYDNDYKWKEARLAADDVLDPVHPWQPPAPYVGTDTYQEQCSESKYYVVTCDKRLVSSVRSKCWFALEEILVEPEGVLPVKRSHVFYRRITLEETKVRINNVPPPICDDSPETVKIVYEAWQERIQHPDRPLAEKKADAEPPAKKIKKR